MSERKVIVDGQALTINDVCGIAGQQQKLMLSDNKSFVRRIDKGAEFIDSLLQEEVVFMA